MQPLYLSTDDLHVRFVGLFDPVGSFVGNADLNALNYAFLPFTIPIQRFSEAIAVGEHRLYFQLFPITNGGNVASADFDQLGFIGAHADVGGGYGLGDGISNATLHWMMAQAESTDTGMSFVGNYPTFNAPYQVVNEVHDSYAAPSGYAYKAIYRSFPSDMRVVTSYSNGQAVTALYAKLTHGQRLAIDPAYNDPAMFTTGSLYSAFLEELLTEIEVYYHLKSEPESVF